jgi:hypothetical protein
MAARVQIEDRGRVYTAVPDVTTRYSALVVGKIESEVANARPPAGIQLEVSRQVEPGPPVVAKLWRDGRFCLTGDLAVEFPVAETVTLSVRAPRYEPAVRAVVLGPGTSVPVMLPTISLRPLPVRIQGRVATKTDGTAIPGARVLTVDDPTLPLPPADHLITLRAPLTVAHAVNTDVEEEAITLPGTVRHLLEGSPRGAAELELDDRSGLTAASVLGIGGNATDALEYLRVLNPGPAPLNTPGRVLLRDSLHQSYAGDTDVRLANLPGSTALGQLSQPAEIGDGLVVIDAVPAERAIVFEPAVPARREFRGVGAISDDGGFYAIAGVARVASFWLDVDAPGFVSEPVPVTVDYERPVTVVDFQL